jgi:hypothetical protein
MVDQGAEYRDALLQYERALRDLAHEALLARSLDALPPATFTTLSGAAGKCTEVLEQFQGQRMPSELHKALTQVTRAIGNLARALHR